MKCDKLNMLAFASIMLGQTVLADCLKRNRLEPAVQYVSEPCPDTRVVESLMALLNHDNFEVRENATLKLIQLGPGLLKCSNFLAGRISIILETATRVNRIYNVVGRDYVPYDSFTIYDMALHSLRSKALANTFEEKNSQVIQILNQMDQSPPLRDLTTQLNVVRIQVKAAWDLLELAKSQQLPQKMIDPLEAEFESLNTKFERLTFELEPRILSFLQAQPNVNIEKVPDDDTALYKIRFELADGKIAIFNFAPRVATFESVSDGNVFQTPYGSIDVHFDEEDITLRQKKLPLKFLQENSNFPCVSTDSGIQSNWVEIRKFHARIRLRKEIGLATSYWMDFYGLTQISPHSYEIVSQTFVDGPGPLSRFLSDSVTTLLVKLPVR